MKIGKIPQSRLSSKGNGNCEPHPQKNYYGKDMELWWKFFRPHVQTISVCAPRTLQRDLLNFGDYIGTAWVFTNWLQCHYSQVHRER